MTTIVDRHGQVTLEAHLGSDLDVVNAARVSFGKRSDALDDAGEKLIGYLVRERHGTPFEHNLFRFHVACPIFVAREWFRHRIGCLAADTLITCVSPNGTVYKRPIEHLYRTHHGSEAPDRWIKNGYQKNGKPARKRVPGTGRYRALGYDRVLRVLDESTMTFTTGTVADVWQAGVKDVYRVTTNDGHVVVASSEHPFLTTEGWVKVKDMTGSEVLVRQGRVAVTPAGQAVPPALRSGIGVWTTMQRKHLIGQGTNCTGCGLLFSADNLHLDHVVPVVVDLTKALDITNLTPLCHACHGAKTATEQGYARRGSTVGPRHDRLVGKPEHLGEQMTYDIEMAGDHHNYLADDLVVHNSFNEMSARYTELPERWWAPTRFDLRRRAGRPGRYEYTQFDEDAESTLGAQAAHRIDRHGRESFALYQRLLAAGVAPEQARAVLPVGSYTEFWWSVNARSLMNFLSLRTAPNAQAEIRAYAVAVEAYFANAMPVTHRAWVDCGRVTP